MSRVGTEAFRARNREALPRHQAVEIAMDVRAELIELREVLADAHRDLLDRRDPRPNLFRADERIVHMAEHTRQWAAAAEGVEYVAPGQVRLPMADGCLDTDGGAA